MTFTVTPLTSCTYVYIHVSHVYKLACTLHRTINLLPLSALSSHIRHLTFNKFLIENCGIMDGVVRKWRGEVRIEDGKAAAVGLRFEEDVK
jgi:hypothetical protein